MEEEKAYVPKVKTQIITMIIRRVSEYPTLYPKGKENKTRAHESTA